MKEVKTKKIIIGLLLILALAAFVGCGNNQNDDVTPDNNGTTNELNDNGTANDNNGNNNNGDNVVDDVEDDVDDLLDGNDNNVPDNDRTTKTDNDVKGGAANQ